MTIDIKIPQIGESITEVELAKWLVADGDIVEKDQEIAEIDSDKATITINAEAEGKLTIQKEEGSSLEIGSIIGQIDTGIKKTKSEETEEPEKSKEDSEKPEEKEEEKKQELHKAEKKEEEKTSESKQGENASQNITFSPQAKKLIDEYNIKIPNPKGTRITKKDILAAISQQFDKGTPDNKIDFRTKPSTEASREEESIKMSTLRRKIAERLVSVKNETAMLTTFNEVDMSKILEIKNNYKQDFLNEFGVKLGFMSFFVKAVTKSFTDFPLVNAHINEGNIIVSKYADIGIAVSTPKGLMVPVIRNAESKSISELEIEIASLAKKARDNKISIDDLSGGTFSITNGGVFGSLLATPIINPPQSAILGMHNIVERPVAINGQVVIRPMMYIALSYDHRIIDGRESVGFLVKIKELLENPGKMFQNE